MCCTAIISPSVVSGDFNTAEWCRHLPREHTGQGRLWDSLEQRTAKSFYDLTACRASAVYVGYGGTERRADRLMTETNT